MRHNRIFTALLLLVSAAALSGCMGVKDLSEEKEDMIAEYAAGVLLQYSDQYDRRLITEEKAADASSTADAAATADPTATPAPTESGGSGSSSSSGASSGSDSSSDSDSSGGSGDGDSQETPESTVSLNKLYRVKGLDFSYDSYEFRNQYGGTVQAEKGQVLLVVHFDVRNTSGRKKKVSLAKRQISYGLTVDGSEYQPQFVILDNMGLNHLITTIPAGKNEDAVLIYRLAKARRSASDITLRIQDGGKTAIIKLK